VSTADYRTLSACQIGFEHPPLHSVSLEVLANSTKHFA